MPIARTCARSGCRRLAHNGARYCTVHATQVAHDDNTRRNTHPRRAVYSTARWRKIRLLVLHRDGYTCIRCGHNDDTGRTLVADHREGVTTTPDPFDIDGIDTLCLTCSGRKDGRRARATGGSY